MADTSLDVEGLLRHLGVRAKNAGGGKWVALCPNPSHPDTSPSWAIIDRPGHRKHGSHFCQSCKWGGGPWELAAAVWGVDPQEAGKRLRDVGMGDRPVAKHAPTVRVVEPGGPSKVFQLPKGTTIPEPGGRWYQPALDYLRARGVTLEQIEKHRIGFATRGLLVNRVVFPVFNARDQLLTFTARGIHPAMTPRYEQGKVRHGAHPRRAIWGEDRWDPQVPRLWVAEGTFSALALEVAGAENVAALLGSELTEEKARILSRWPEIVVATDPDAAGEKIARKLSVLARRSRLYRPELAKSPDDLEPGELSEIIDRARIFFA